MAYNDTTEYPRGVWRIFSLTNSLVLISSDPIKISGVIVTEAAANPETVAFRPVGSILSYFQLQIAANESKFFPVRCFLPDLEIVSTAGTVHVTIFFDNSGASLIPFAVG